MNVAHTYQSILRREKPLRPNLTALNRGVRDINRIADEVDDLERNAIDHLAGHRQFERLAAEYKETLERPSAFAGESLGKVLELGNRTLEHVGLELLRRGDILPWLRLVRTDLGSWEPNLIIAFVSGPERACVRHSPVTPHLIQDDTAKRSRVDCTTTFPAVPEDDDWGHWDLTQERESFAATTRALHAFLERRGLTTLGCIVRLAGCRGLNDLLGVQVLADWCSRPAAARGSRSTAAGEAAALAHLIDGADIRPAARLDPATYAAVESQVQALLERAETLLAREERNDGVAGRRTGGSTQLGLLPSGILLPSLCDRLSALDPEAGELARRLRERLADPRRYVASGASVTSIPIDIADLEASGPRKALAAIHLQEMYADFHDRHLGPEYDKWMLEPSGCPQPFQGDLPLAARVKAAVGAQLLGDLQQVINQAPGHLFDLSQIPIPETCNEEGRKALQGMVTALQEALKKAVIFLSVTQTLGDPVASIFQAWQAQNESRTPFRAKGISGLETLLEPALFFSDVRFKHLLRHESIALVEPWTRMRALASRMSSCIGPTRNDWSTLRRTIILPMVEVMLEMGLKVVNGLDGQPATSATGLLASWRTPLPNYFQRPPSFPSQRLLAVSESALPLEVVDANPGHPAVYAALKHRNGPAIRRLAQALDQSPRRPRPVIAHAQERGPLLDPMAIRLAHTGRLWRRVRKANRSVPLHPVLALLMDFSGSMTQPLVASAKDVAVSLAEALGARATVLFYLYSSGGLGYRLIRIMDGQSRGMSQMAAIAAPETRAGSGLNPDAACLLGLLSELEAASPGGGATICHLSDFELCRSLSVAGLDTPEQELQYALECALKAGHGYIAARVGRTDQDPIHPAISHDYLYLGSGSVLDPGAVTSLLAILRERWEI